MTNSNLKKDDSTRKTFFNLEKKAPTYNYLTKSKSDKQSCLACQFNDKIIPKL